LAIPELITRTRKITVKVTLKTGMNMRGYRIEEV